MSNTISPNSKPMSDAHIHAYVDRQLKLEREERLQQLVSAWPEKYEQVQEYQIINQRLEDGLADVYHQTIPQSLLSILSSPPPTEKKHNSVKDFLKSKASFSRKPKPEKKIDTSNTPDDKKTSDAPLESKFSFEDLASIDGGIEENGERTIDVDLPKNFRIKQLFSSFYGTITATKKLLSGKIQLIASIIFGVVIGWVAHNSFNASANSNDSFVAQSAIDAHVFYTAETKHAVEVSAMNKKHLRSWIKKNLDSALDPVNLSKFGYELMGGRVLPLKGKLAGQYMYQSTKNKSRLTIFMSRYLQDKSDKNPRCDSMDDFGTGELSVCGWKKDKLVFYVIGQLSRKDMSKVAERVKKLMPKKKK